MRILEKIKDLPREKKHFALMTMPEEAWMEERKNQVSPRKWYAELWDSINKKRGYGWEINPFVWVIKFKVIK